MILVPSVTNAVGLCTAIFSLLNQHVDSAETQTYMFTDLVLRYSESMLFCVHNLIRRHGCVLGLLFSCTAIVVNSHCYCYLCLA